METLLAKSLFLKVGRKLYQVVSFEQASRMVCAARDETDRRTGQASSAFIPPMIVDEAGAVVAHVSYNGRVWAGAGYVADAVPLYDNRVQA